MRPHQSCGLLCQLNHPLTREKSTVDKQHQFQRLAGMNLNTATRPSRTAGSHQTDRLDVTDRPTRRCRMMCCCSRCWNKRQLTSRSPGSHLRSPGREGRLILVPMLVKDVNRRLVTGDVQVQTLLLSASAAGLSACYRVKLPARLIEMPYTPFYLHTLTYAAVRPPVASALSSSGETDGDSEFW